MDDFFDGLNGSEQDNLELAALKYFEELDRQPVRQPVPVSRPEPKAPERSAPVTDEEIMPDLADSGMDSVILSLMADPVNKPVTPRPVPSRPLTRPVFRKKAAERAKPEAAPDAPLSQLARKAAGLFDSLPTEDQLLAYSLLQKLAKAAEASK